MKAEFVQDLDSFTGVAKLYKLDQPYKMIDPIDAKEVDVHYIVVSATMAFMSGPETYIFAADAAADILDWLELPGSYRGGLDHDEALEGFLEHCEEYVKD